MAFTNTKRKRAEEIRDDRALTKPQRRHHSEHAPLSSIDYEATLQLRNRSTRRVDDIANTSTTRKVKQQVGSSIPEVSSKVSSHIKFKSEAEATSELKQPLFAETLNSSADEAPPLSLKKAKAKSTNSFKAPPIQNDAKQHKPSGRASGSSTDQAPALKPTKTGPSKKIVKKQEVSSSGPSSLDEGYIADPSDANADAASKRALVAASTLPSEEPSGEEDGSEDEEEDEDEFDKSSSSRDRKFSGDQSSSDEDKEREELDPEDEENRVAGLETKAEAQARSKKKRPASDPDSATSSDSSMEWASDAVSDSDGEPHPDKKKKEIVKADDPNAFAASMHGILGYKLTRTQRENPILARSADAKEADETLLDLKLEKKAKAEMRREKVEKGGQGRQTGGMLREIHGKGAGDMVDSTLWNSDVEGMGSVSAYQRHEKELRKMAQRGVVKMFNAFAHVSEKAIEAQGMVGSKAKKEEKVTKMTKEGWLEHIGLGGK